MLKIFYMITSIPPEPFVPPPRGPLVTPEPSSFTYVMLAGLILLGFRVYKRVNSN